MSPEKPEDRDAAYWCGRLYASVLALKQLANPGYRIFPDGNKLMQVGKNPASKMREDWQTIGSHLLKAMKNGPGPGKAAESVFREIPELTREISQTYKELPHSLREAEARNFSAGCMEQLAEYERAHGEHS